jgi:hypothetical protein
MNNKLIIGLIVVGFALFIVAGLLIANATGFFTLSSKLIKYKPTNIDSKITNINEIYKKLNIFNYLCLDSDSGKNYFIKGTIQGKLSGGQSHTGTDSCVPISWVPGNLLREYYCENNYVYMEDINCNPGFVCYNGTCQKNSILQSQGIYLGCTNPLADNYDPNANTDNNEYSFTKYGLCKNANKLPQILDKQYIENVTGISLIATNDINIKINKIMAIVPEGYLEIAKKQIQDLNYCYNLVPKFIGIEPYFKGIIIKTVISQNNENLGTYQNEKGNIVYIRSKENINLDLNNILINSPNGFYFNSSPTYCSNTHEFTHFIVDPTRIPNWANEGIAEYSQKYNQIGSKKDIICTDNGWYGFDWWVDDQNKLFNYSDLSLPSDISNEPGYGPKWYRSAMCFWELFDKKFSAEKRQLAFKLLVTKSFDGTPVANNSYTNFFINEILYNTVSKTDLDPLLKKFNLIK